MHSIQIAPDLIKKGLSLYTIPSQSNGKYLNNININGEIVKEYTTEELYFGVGNVKIVLCNWENSVTCEYD